MTIEERVAALEASIAELRPASANSTPTLEERVAALEAAVAEWKRTREKPKGLWAVAGMFKDDPDFAEMNRLGRYLAEHDRYPDEANESES